MSSCVCVLQVAIPASEDSDPISDLLGELEASPEVTLRFPAREGPGSGFGSASILLAGLTAGLGAEAYASSRSIARRSRRRATAPRLLSA